VRLSESSTSPCWLGAIEEALSIVWDESHLWIIKIVDGAAMRFELQQSERIRFDDRNLVYDSSDAMPEPYRLSDRHICDNPGGDTYRLTMINEIVPATLISQTWAAATRRFSGFDSL
jgi:hypothetical protein